MSFSPRRSVHARLLGGFLVVSGLTVLVGGGAVAGMHQIRTQTERVHDEGTVPLAAVMRLESQFWTYQAWSARSSLQGFSDAQLAQTVQETDAAFDELGTLVAAAQETALDPAAADAVAVFEADLDRMLPALEAIGAAMASGDGGAVDGSIADYNALTEEMLGAVGTATEAQQAHSQDVVDEARSTSATVTTLLVIEALVAVLVSVALGLRLAGGVIRPLRRVTEVARGMASGDLAARAEVRGHDETAEMAHALNAGLDAVAALVRTAQLSSDELAEAAAQLDRTTDVIVSGLSSTSDQAGGVAGAAEIASSNVSTVAAATDEMTGAIREIAQNAQEAARVANEATQVAAQTNLQVARLGDSSQQIGEVIKAITAIAEQTNLLALNATIEAARAGESGKGFAVVAGEVKELARETAQATEDIARRVQAIQTDSGEAAQALGQIGDIIASINDYQTRIAAAVEEQTATTQEMSRSVAEAALSTSAIAGSIAGVAASSAESSDGAQHVRDASRGLLEMSGRLRTAVAAFRV